MVKTPYTNRVTLDQLTDMTVGEAAQLPVEQIVALAGDIAALERKAKSAKAYLNLVVQHKYGLTVKGAPGTHRIHDGEYDVVVTVPKRVEWDNDALAVIAADMAHEGVDPGEYIEVKRTVPERKFNAWPTAWQAAFVAARAVKVGSPTVKFERKEVA